METMKIFRNDLLIEWFRERFADRRFSCLHCPVNKECFKFARFTFSPLCDEVYAEEFKQAIIDGFSTDVEVEQGMSDLIRRQDAIEAIEKYLDKFDCIDANFLDGLKTTKKILNDLPSAQPKQRWIPCSERLPEKYVEVLVSVNYKYKGEPKERYTDIGSLTEKGWAFVWDVYHRLNEFNEVIAWMPLPDAYEEDD